MLKRGLKENKNNITEAQLQHYAERTDGFSGSDLAVLVKDAVYEPVRKLQAARKFRRLQNGKLLPVGEQEYGPDII
jgi:vacuolar protein-sorting-associated protein 4